MESQAAKGKTPYLPAEHDPRSWVTPPRRHRVPSPVPLQRSRAEGTNPRANRTKRRQCASLNSNSAIRNDDSGSDTADVQIPIGR